MKAFLRTRSISSKSSRKTTTETGLTHKTRYEQSVLAPALELITALQKPLAKARCCELNRNGWGSLMRIYKDTRFSKDKTPYKTNVGIQFRHQRGGDVHAPGVYLHVSPAECFLGVGTWRPPSDALRRIRDYIISHETTWIKLLKQKKFNAAFTMHEDRLKSTPRGYDKHHPLIDELRQQSFIGMASAHSSRSKPGDWSS
ncbi:MAG: TIGR02453 family protein [Pirellulaceae bacterium]